MSNLDWIKSYSIKHKFFCFHFFQFWEKKSRKFMTHKWPFFDHFWSFFCLLHENLEQTWGPDGHFEVLSMLKSKLDQELRHNMGKIFFSWYHFRGKKPKWALTPRMETSSYIFNINIFSKFFEAFMSHIIR